jgi:flagellin-like protein
MKGISEVIAIILILLIVVALAMLAYQWFGAFYHKFVDAGKTVSNQTHSVPSASDIMSLMKSMGCSGGLYIWYDGTLKCSRQDCKPDGYCKYVYDDVV